MTYIYGLRCPIDNKIRYVGKADDPDRRYGTHVTLRELGAGPHAALSPKQAWIKTLQDKGLRPDMVVLEKVGAETAVWRAAERRWIEHLLAEGHPLTNSSILRRGVPYKSSWYATRAITATAG
jgi:hypothetical protein